jgi:bacterioferritin
MAEAPAFKELTISRDELADLLNQDLAREYQAIIAYVVYSQVLKGAEYMEIAKQLEGHAHDELKHAITISRQIDYLGKMPTVSAKPVRTSDDPRGCCASTWTTRMTRCATTPSESVSARR